MNKRRVESQRGKGNSINTTSISGKARDHYKFGDYFINTFLFSKHLPRGYCELEYKDFINSVPKLWRLAKK